MGELCGGNFKTLKDESHMHRVVRHCDGMSSLGLPANKRNKRARGTPSTVSQNSSPSSNQIHARRESDNALLSVLSSPSTLRPCTAWCRSDKLAAGSPAQAHFGLDANCNVGIGAEAGSDVVISGTAWSAIVAKLGLVDALVAQVHRP